MWRGEWCLHFRHRTVRFSQVGSSKPPSLDILTCGDVSNCLKRIDWGQSSPCNSQGQVNRPEKQLQVHFKCDKISLLMVAWMNNVGLYFPDRHDAIPDLYEYALMHSRTLHLNMNPKCFVKRNLHWRGAPEPWILFSACPCNVLFPLSSLQRHPGLHLKIFLPSRTWQTEKYWTQSESPPNYFFNQLRPLFGPQQRWGLIADMSLRLTLFIPFRLRFPSD